LELSERLSISQPTASQSVKPGEKVVKEKKLNLMGRPMPIYQYPSPPFLKKNAILILLITISTFAAAKFELKQLQGAWWSDSANPTADFSIEGINHLPFYTYINIV